MTLEQVCKELRNDIRTTLNALPESVQDYVADRAVAALQEVWEDGQMEGSED